MWGFRKRTITIVVEMQIQLGMFWKIQNTQTLTNEFKCQASLRLLPLDFTQRVFVCVESNIAQLKHTSPKTTTVMFVCLFVFFLTNHTQSRPKLKQKKIQKKNSNTF